MYKLTNVKIRVVCVLKKSKLYIKKEPFAHNSCHRLNVVLTKTHDILKSQLKI